MAARSYVNGFVDGNRVVLLRREGERLVADRVPAEWVGYLRATDVPEDLLRQIRGSRHIISFREEEGGWYRLGFRDEMARRLLLTPRKDGQKSVLAERPTFEGDVDPVRRWTTDNESGVDVPRGCYLDIETDSRLPFTRKAEMRILTWVVKTVDGEVWRGVLEAETDEAERACVTALLRAMADCDQIIAWNGDRFDFEVLKARATRLDIAVDFRRWLLLDQMVLWRRMNTAAESGDEKQSLSLESLGQKILGRGKTEVPEWVRERFGDKALGALSWELWEAGGRFRELLLKYNQDDVELQAGLEEATGYIALFQTLCEACGVFACTRSLNPTQQMDGFMLRLGRARGHRFPTKEYVDADEKPFAGAYVMQPRVKGIGRAVHVCDFASLYPSIILTFNMSPETKVNGPINGPIPEGHCRVPKTGLMFRNEVDGILPVALREMIRLRKYWADRKASLTPGTPEWYDADRRSTAYKVAANSFYGVVGSPFSRYYDRNLAESVTQAGVWLLEQTLGAMARRKIDAVYGDTDSAFGMGCSVEEFAEFVRWCNADVYPDLLAAQGCRLEHASIKLAYEKAFDRIVFVTAKRYIGSFLHYKGKAASATSKPEIKGIEYKRGDALQLARRLQGRVIDLLVGGLGLNPGAPCPTDDLSRFQQVISDARHHVLSHDLPREEVQLSKALSKPLSGYVTKRKQDGTVAGQGSHVDVAHVLKARGREVDKGTRIAFVVVDGEQSPVKAIPAEDYVGEFDRYHLWEALVWPPTGRLLAAAFPEQDWDAWGKVRPPKVRKRSEVGAAPAPQLSLMGVELSRGVGIAPTSTYQVRFEEHEVVGRLEELRAVFLAHPGLRPLQITLRLPAGAEADLDCPGLRVSGSRALEEAVAAFRTNLAA